MKKTRIILVVAFFFLLTSFDKGIRFRKIDMSSGLSYNSVLCISEDHQGLLWIGTREGLNKYNSQDNIIYKHRFNDPSSLSNNHINCVFESSANDIWVGTANGLNRYNKQKDNFFTFSVAQDSTGLSNGYVKTIEEFKAGELWVGTSNGLNIYDPLKESFRQIFISQSPSPANNVIALFCDNAGLMWVGTKKGLFLWNNKEFKQIILEEEIENLNQPFEIRDIKQDNNGVMLIGTEEYGLYSFRYNNEEIKQLSHFYTGNSSIISDHIRKIYADNSTVWLATLSGICILESGGNKITNIEYSFERPEGISRSSIHDIIKDRNGGYWFASYTGGLNYYHKQNNLFAHYKRIAGSANSLSDEVVNSFLEDKAGNVWIGTGASGLNYLNLSTGMFEFVNSGLSNNVVKSMISDKRGNLWIGSNEGLNYYNRETKNYTKYLHDPGNPNSLNQNQVHALHIDSDGLVWIGMNGGEFQVFDPSKNRFENVPGVGAIISALYEDSNGLLWIGERVGLKCLNRKTRILVDISHLTSGIEEELNFITWISQDSKGRIWIGTQSSGLFIIRSDKIYSFRNDNGLPDNTVNAILEENDGRFWISTTKGISGIEYSEDNAGNPMLKSSDFTSVNGLQGEQFNPGSAMKSSSGMLYFGGTNGFNTFFPGEIKKEVFLPQIMLSELIINSEIDKSHNFDFKLPLPINECRELILKYSERNIFLRFAAVNFVNPDGTYYRYILSGMDKDWIDIGNQRTINFTYLPVGEHELRIKASTSQDAWGDTYRSLRIIILPPWWKTWWAWLLYFMLVIGLMFGFYFYIQRLTTLKHKLNLEQYMREKEQKLLESKLDFFTDVSHELRTPLTLILAPLEKIMLQSGLTDPLNQQLLMIQRNGNRMMRMINDVLNLRKLEAGQYDKLRAASGNFGRFLQEISLAFEEMASSRNINFTFVMGPGNFNLWYDRNKMEIIIHNLLSNAFKHTSEGGNIRLSLEMKNAESVPQLFQMKFRGEYAEISISDDGKGITQESLKHIFERFYSNDNHTESNSTGVGLELTKRMVEIHKGFIFAESRPESENERGFTKFTFYIPSGNKHLSAEELIRDFKSSEDLSRYTNELKLHEKTGSQLPGEVDTELPKISDKDKQTLLIVEDNEEVRTFIKSLFLDNYLVEEAGNGKTGWEIASTVLPDLVISDIMMPEMNGIELCRKLKTDVRTSHIPVILLTARAILSIKYEGYETGADEYITKPFSSQYLTMRVKNLIKQRRTLQEHFKRETILRPENITVTSVDERLLKKAVDYINQNITNPEISVERLSAEIGLSRVHFYRKIKSLTNLTAVDFIRTIRLKSAAMLLRQNKLSIKEVQNRVGFENADYFRKCFKEQFGVTPSEFAKKG